MAQLLTKEDLILKLSPYRFKSWASVNRLIREQNLPAKYFTPRKVGFDEAEVDTWIARRNSGIAKSDATHAKVLKAQRQRRKSPQASATAEFKAEA